MHVHVRVHGMCMCVCMCMCMCMCVCMYGVCMHAWRVHRMGAHAWHHSTNALYPRRARSTRPSLYLLRLYLLWLHLPTAHAHRIYEAIAAGCIPVIIADRLQLPFARRLAWPTFSVRITEA